MIVNTTVFNNVTNIGLLFQSVNSVTNNYFMPISLFGVIMLVVMISARYLSFPKALIVGNFVGSIIGILLMLGGFLAYYFAIVPLVLLLGSVSYVFFT